MLSRSDGSRADRTLIGIASAFGLLAALRFLTGPSPEQQLPHYLLLLCNVPGFLIAAIPFVALGGLRRAHAGLVRFYSF